MTALENWKKAHPRDSELLMRALGEYFGLTAPTLSCPNCKVTLELTVSARKSNVNHRQWRKARIRSKPSAKIRGQSLKDLINKLARARKRRTGDINADFKRSLGRRATRMNPAKFRELKMDWLKNQLRTIRP